MLVDMFCTLNDMISINVYVMCLPAGWFCTLTVTISIPVGEMFISYQVCSLNQLTHSIFTCRREFLPTGMNFYTTGDIFTMVIESF